MVKQFDGKDWIVCLNLLILGVLITLYTHDFAGIVGYLLLFSTYAQIRARFEYMWNEMVRVRIYAESVTADVATHNSELSRLEGRIDELKGAMVCGFPVQIYTAREKKAIEDQLTMQEERVKYLASQFARAEAQGRLPVKDWTKTPEFFAKIEEEMKKGRIE